MAEVSGQDLDLELRDKLRLLDISLREFGKRGRAYAEAERDYRVADQLESRREDLEKFVSGIQRFTVGLAKKVLIERAGGQPVTIISDICRGNAEIADLRFKRDVAEVDYKAAQEAINSYKLQIKILEAQRAREWGA